VGCRTSVVVFGNASSERGCPRAHKQVSPGLAYVVPEAGEDDAVVASDEDDVDSAAEDDELVEVVVVTGLVVLEPVEDGTVELVVVADGKLVLVELDGELVVLGAN
jgi:hypothetical protein